MKNKEEILYNSKSIIDTWMYGCSKYGDLRLIFEGKDRNMIIPCSNIEDAGKKLGDTLCSNNGEYTLCKLCGVLNKENKEFGKLDII